MQPRTDPTTFYVLTASSAPSSAPDDASRVIGLGPIRLPDYLDRPQLVTRLAANQLRISESERWAEPLADAFVDRVRRDLAAILQSDTIVAYPWDSSQHPALQVAIEVLRFERTSPEAVELDVRWTIRDDAQHLLQTKESHIRQPTVAPDAQSAVAALSETLAALSREMAATLRGLSHR
ncbi:MAG TPA: PqiC family protein [Polyangia bacterium]